MQATEARATRAPLLQAKVHTAGLEHPVVIMQQHHHLMARLEHPVVIMQQHHHLMARLEHPVVIMQQHHHLMARLEHPMVMIRCHHHLIVQGTKRRSHNSRQKITPAMVPRIRKRSIGDSHKTTTVETMCATMAPGGGGATALGEGTQLRRVSLGMSPPTGSALIPRKGIDLRGWPVGPTGMARRRNLMMSSTTLVRGAGHTCQHDQVQCGDKAEHSLRTGWARAYCNTLMLTLQQLGSA